ncbi:hypothetical protein [Botrimarina sp.]|uniref:hypothetical protein n=1 Tax=Botrimarina sp. TaxID=2795802 RepID=UPI0032EC9DD0
MLSGDRDFGLFKIALAAADSLEQPRWRRDGRAWSYRWRYDAGIVVGFRAEPAADCVVLRYEVENRTGAPLPRVLVHPCIVTTRAPSFFAPAVGAGDDPSPSKRSAPHAELFGRVWLWRCGERFAFADLDLTPEEPHTAVMRAGEPPVAWAWWVNSSAVFDESLIVLEASHASGSLGIWFEEAVWASVNAGDERACVHLFPSFGDLAPGERGVVHGRLLISELGVDATRRWLLDQRRAAPLQ